MSKMVITESAAPIQQVYDDDDFEFEFGMVTVDEQAYPAHSSKSHNEQANNTIRESLLFRQMG